MLKPGAVEIQLNTLLKAIAICVIVYIVFAVRELREILIMLFFAMILASAANPPARRLENYGLPRVLALLIVYIGAVIVLSLLIALVVRPLAHEIRQAADIVPGLIDRINFPQPDFLKQPVSNELQQVLINLSDRLREITSNLLGLVSGIIGGFFSTIMAIVMSFYLALEDRGIRRFIYSLTPSPHKDRAVELWERSQKRLGAWLRGQLVLMLAVGTASYIALLILGIPYALGLGILAGLLEVIPYVGPITAAIPAVLIALISKPLWVAIGVIVAFFLVQYLEAYILVPQVMRRVLRLNPIIVILVLTIGAKLGGIMGIIMALPLTVLVAELTRDSLGVSIYHSGLNNKVEKTE